tara:strand:- start:718 stop:1038 length:321 start_codon:yes stop_codon:yes gene_type:complete
MTTEPDPQDVQDYQGRVSNASFDNNSTQATNSETRHPLFTQAGNYKRKRVPVDFDIVRFGASADQTPQKVVYVPGVVNEDGEIEGEESLTLVPHNMRCEPPRGFNR